MRQHRIISNDIFDENAGAQSMPQVDDTFIFNLLNGLTACNLPRDVISAAIDQLANLSPQDKKTVAAKTCYFFYATKCDNFSQLSTEDSNGYVSRICQLITTKVNDNLAVVADEEKQKNEYQARLVDSAAAYVSSASSSSVLKPVRAMGSLQLPH